MIFDPSLVPTLHENPMYIMELQQRYQHVTDLAGQVQKFDKIIMHYVQTGEQLCDTLKEALDSLKEIEFVCTNRNIGLIIQAMDEFQSTLRNHFEENRRSTEKSIKKFMKKDFADLAEAKRVHSKNIEKYLVVKDHYLSLPKKSKQKHIEEREIEYRRAFTDSASSLFEYLIKIDATEAHINFMIGDFLTNFPKSYIGATKDVLRKAAKTIEQVQKSDDSICPDYRKIKKRIKECRNNFISSIPSFFQHLNSHAEPDKEMVLKQGYLWKKSGNFGKTWERLYFVCNNGVISYSPSVEMAHNPSKTIQLSLASAQVNEVEDRPYVFNIITQSKTYTLQAPSQYDCDEWINTIQNGIEANLSSLSTSPAQKRNIANRMPRNLSSLTVCADCNSSKADWYILNRALVVCEKCAGIHRSIPQTSKIRSLSLDKIDKYHTKMREILCDNVMNKFIQFDSGEEKLIALASQEERHTFIIHKYVDKLFYDKTTELPNIFDAIKDNSLIDIMKIAFVGGLGNDVFLRNGFKPIHAAACVGNPVIIIAIIENSNQIDDLDANGWSALSYASFHNNAKAVRALIEYGADATVTADDVAPYVIAKELGHEEIMNILKAYAIEYNEDNLPAFVPVNSDFEAQPIPQSMDIREEGEGGPPTSPTKMKKGDRMQIQLALKNMAKRPNRRKSVASCEAQKMFYNLDDPIEDDPY